jgi:hypothetical protein
MFASRAQGTAGERNRITFRASEWKSILHQAITDSGSHCDVHENAAALSSTEHGFGESAGANVRLNLRGGNPGQPPPHRCSAPPNGLVTGDIAVVVHKFGNTSSDACNFDGMRLCPIDERYGNTKGIFQYRLPAARRLSRDDHTVRDLSRRPQHDSSSNLRASDVQADCRA